MIKSISKRIDAFIGKLMTTPVVLHAKETCPECGSQLAREPAGEEASSVWHCPNPDCPAQVRRGLGHWCSPAAMDITGGDERLVALLVRQGLVRDVAELYRLRVKELAALPGVDKDLAQKFFDAITASRKREAWRVLSGLGIPCVGAAEAQLFCEHFATLDALFATGRERLTKLAGITEVMARSLTHWSGDPVNQKLIRRLEKAGVNFKTNAG